MLPALLAATPKTGEVRLQAGRTTLFVDDQPVVPDFYALTHAYGARWSWEEVPQRNLKNFADLGFRLFQLDLYFEDIWRKDVAALDLAKAQHQIRGLLEVCPDAGIVMRIHVNAPFWWNEAHREECATYADGPVDQRSYGPPFNNEDGDVDRPLRASLASLKWRHEAGEKLREFCRRLAATPEGDAVIGMHVSGGVYGEWHNWGFIDHDPDTSPAMTAYFRDWLHKKYGNDSALRRAWRSDRHTLATATVPDLAEREFTGDGIFRDPQQEQRVIDYFTAQHEVVAEDIEEFTGIVKHTWPRPLIVGVFYGYLHMTFCRQAAGGHLAIERILNCPTIDYLSAPQSYWGPTQNAGGSGNSRGLIESTQLHGKLWLDELDNGHIQKKTALDPVRNSGKFDPEYVPVLQRSALLPLMRGGGLWYYDFGPRESFGWWDSPAYLEGIRKVKGIFDARLGQEHAPVADVLYVWDQESFYYVKNRFTPVAYDLIDQAAEEALRAGAAGDHIYLFDLGRVDLRRYRAVMFMNVYKLSAAQRDFIHRVVARDGRTLIWNYLPGYTDGARNSLAFVEELTGFALAPHATTHGPTVRIELGGGEYSWKEAVVPMAVIAEPGIEILARLKDSGEPIVARKVSGDATHVFSTLPLHDTAFFRALFRRAGCHVYNDTNDFTYANSGLLMVHTRTGGQRTLHLRNGKDISLELPPFSTWLLDANSGEVLLK
ncbi:MAG: hypothetical protein WCR49_10900 [Opitutae bacterium]